MLGDLHGNKGEERREGRYRLSETWYGILCKPDVRGNGGTNERHAWKEETSICRQKEDVTGNAGVGNEAWEQMKNI